MTDEKSTIQIVIDKLGKAVAALCVGAMAVTFQPALVKAGEYGSELMKQLRWDIVKKELMLAEEYNKLGNFEAAKHAIAGVRAELDKIKSTLGPADLEKFHTIMRAGDEKSLERN